MADTTDMMVERLREKDWTASVSRIDSGVVAVVRQQHNDNPIVFDDADMGRWEAGLVWQDANGDLIIAVRREADR